MIQGPEDQQIVHAMLSAHLEVLESIQEYVQLCYGGKSHFSAAIMERLNNLSCQCKLVTAATKELLCYAAVSEIDAEILTKFN
jgi:galactokinase/mevalonate kinase-like predicted kinase